MISQKNDQLFNQQTDIYESAGIRNTGLSLAPDIVVDSEPVTFIKQQQAPPIRYAGTIFETDSTNRVANATVTFMPSGKRVMADGHGYFETNFDGSNPQSAINITAAEFEAIDEPISELKTIFFARRRVKTLGGVTVTAKKKAKAKPKNNGMMYAGLGLLGLLLLTARQK